MTDNWDRQSDSDGYYYGPVPFDQRGSSDPVFDPRWDAVAVEIGLPADWRAQGYDSPEYMASADSIYRSAWRGPVFYCYPGTIDGRCSFTFTDDVETLFRHVHSVHSVPFKPATPAIPTKKPRVRKKKS